MHHTQDPIRGGFDNWQYAILVESTFFFLQCHSQRSFSVILSEAKNLRSKKNMASSPQKTLLCITSYQKGQEFIRECKRQGAYVILLTVTDLDHANWPLESIDEIFYMPDLSKNDDVISVVSFLARTRSIDLIVA